MYELQELLIIAAGMHLNGEKSKVMRRGMRHIVTGIVVNEKRQLPREYRMRIRKEIHYIEKFRLSNHIEHTGETRAHYLQHLLGKIRYALWIDPEDSKMQNYLQSLTRKKY